MNNLQGLRKVISDAERDNSVTVTIKTEEAKLYVRQAEKMHGGNRMLVEYQREIAELKSKIQKLKSEAVKVDKVAELLEG